MIDRYDCTEAYGSKTGDWVTLEDYEKLEKHIASLEEYIRVTEDEPLSKLKADAIREMVKKVDSHEDSMYPVQAIDVADIEQYVGNLDSTE